jgi:DNA-directed RNA polymerase subunit RPC12/RpoP
MHNATWFPSLSKDKQNALLTQDGYRNSCPDCNHKYVTEVDNGRNCFDLGTRRYWVHYCEMDDNLYSDEIWFCPYCGYKLPTTTHSHSKTPVLNSATDS